MTNYTFDQLLDFTRTTAGSFVDSNGLIQNTPASVNLLLQTQQFDNAAWSKVRTTITANSTVAPDGTSTADKLVEDTTASSTHFTSQSANYTAGTTYTLSVSVKAAERSWFDIQLPAALMGTIRNAFFDVSNGTVGTVTSGVTAAIVSTGNGWYRCSVTFTPTASAGTGSAFLLANADNSISYTGDGTSGLFLWGAQLEVGSTATTYTRNNGGRFPPRFDYDPVTLQPKGILIEEQRVNLLLRSEEFDVSWTGFVATVSSNAAVSPDGTTDADKIIPDNAASLGSSGVTQTVTAAAATYTYSVYAKIGEYNRVRLLVRDSASAANNASVIVSLVDGTITTAAAAAGTFTGASATVIAAKNGFYRVSLTFTSTGASSVLVRAFVADSVATTGDGTSGIFLWGAQLEAGAFATSYIPTVASQVTRAADSCAIVAPMFAPWYNQSEGTFVVQASYAVASNLGDRFTTQTDDDTANNRLLTTIDTGAVDVGGARQATIDGGTPIDGLPNKLAFGYKINDFAVSLNGAAVVTDTSGTIPTVNRVIIGSRTGGASFLNGHIRSVQYYPVRLADFQLQALSA
jgi:hypothetical protein